MLGQFGIGPKIGLHSGDVLIESVDIYGDNVNVASKLVNLAKANQIVTTLSFL